MGVGPGAENGVLVLPFGGEHTHIPIDDQHRQIRASWGPAYQGKSAVQSGPAPRDYTVI